ncbi:DUF2279 domain-containing protein [Persicobacter sp. CCB-QB2]|uniref:DUF2279 domain-containing protein n=1 Tax=Persicobacter sp. CCB-QB2 TaxID=1561025 RepID=UPI0009E32427|nr:DUF2279 domain-containing protein [Persicobacter sp. CCB-QB2]
MSLSAAFWWLPLLCLILWMLMDSLPFKAGGEKAKLPKRLFYFLFWYVLLVVGLAIAWYQHMPLQGFHFFNDLDEWMGMDKLGHFFTCFQMVRWMNAYLKADIAEDQKRHRFAFLSGALVLFPIELMDGFGAGYGFSVYDMLANALGAFAAFIQLQAWGKVKWFPRFSFWPSDWAQHRPQLLGNNLGEQLLKDYNGQVYWSCYSLRALLRKPWVPSFLMLAIGYRAQGMVYGRLEENLAQGYQPTPSLLLSVDFDYEQLPLGPFKKIQMILEMIKLPMPTVEVNSRGEVGFSLFYI